MFHYKEYEIRIIWTEMPSMMGYGTETVCMLKKINYWANTVEDISYDDVKAMYKELDTKRDRIQCWLMLKQYKEFHNNIGQYV